MLRFLSLLHTQDERNKGEKVKKKKKKRKKEKEGEETTYYICTLGTLRYYM